MADHLLPGLENFKQSLSLADIDPNIEFINHFSAINPSHQQPSGLNIHSLMGLPLDNLFPHLPESSENFPGLFIHEDNTLVPRLSDHVISNENDQVDRKRKAMEISTLGNSSAISTPQVSDNGIRRKNVRF